MASTLPFLPLAPLITFEGIDGSGKSTAMRSVAASLDAWTTREETDRFGPAIRRSIKAGRDPLVTTYLFLADRFAHAAEIRRHLAAGEVVLCDRFTHSTLAYQGVTLAGRMADPEAWLRALHAPMALEPDLVLWFDVPVDVALERVDARGKAAPYEKRAFLEQVAERYRDMAQRDPRMLRIDAAKTMHEVAAAASAAVARAIGHAPEATAP